jgi:hypothetical protein
MLMALIFRPIQLFQPVIGHYIEMNDTGPSQIGFGQNDGWKVRRGRVRRNQSKTTLV